MSRELSIEVSTIGTTFLAVVDVLVNAGWAVRDIEGISYLPESAADVSDWKMFSGDSVPFVLEQCGRREAAGLPPAVVLLRRNEQRGGQFLWLDGRTLLVTLNVNLAHDWDFDRAVTEVGRPIEDAGIAIERFAVERC